MTDFATADYFSDQEIAQEPYEYLDYLREQNPVFQEPKYHVYAVTGYDETVAAFRAVTPHLQVKTLADARHVVTGDPEGAYANAILNFLEDAAGRT